MAPDPALSVDASGRNGPRALPLRGARPALALLLCMNMFNYIDRQVLAAVEPEIRESLVQSHDAGESNVRARMGLLSSAFLLSYMFAAPLFGVLAERWSRWRLIALGVILWTLASGASGLAATFTILLVTRCFVGVGEGAYGPIAPAVLSDYFPVAVRGRVMAWFYMAIPVGGALGYALGGHFAGWDPARQSWRWACYAVVVPGLLLGLWSFWMGEPQRGAADRLSAPPRRATLKDYLVLLSTPSYVLDTLGMAAMTFAIGALAFWMPDYLKSHGVPPVCHLAPVTFFGIVTAVAGLMATMAGGMAGDWLRGRFSGSYFLVSGVGLLLCVPCTLLFVAIPFPAAWVFVFLSVFFLFFNTGPTNTILANVTHPSMRAAAFAVNILVIHTLGDVISPPVIGAIADRTSLACGFVVVSIFMAMGSVLWLWGTRYLERDTAAAPGRLG